MPLPGEVRVVDPVATGWSVQFANDMTGMIGSAIAPVVNVAPSGTFYKYESEQMFRTYETRRAARSEYRQIDWSVESDTFKCVDHGLEGMIDDEERDEAQVPLALDRDTTEIVTNAVVLGLEVEQAASVNVAASFPSGSKVTLGGTDQWSDYVNSDPVDDIETGIEKIISLTGKAPNICWMGRQTWRQLKSNTQMLAKLPNTQLQQMDFSAFKDLFGFDKILIGGGIRSTANPAATTDVRTFIWGKHFGMAYSEPRPGLKKASFAYTLVSRRLRVVRYRKEARKSDVIRVERKGVVKIVASTCGYFITDAVG